MRLDSLHLARSLRRSPASAVAAVLTLSMTIGAGASIFAVVDAVLLTPPPFANPDGLVTLGEIPIDAPTSSPRAVPYATFEAWRERAGALASLEAFEGTNLTLTGLGAAERVSATDVTPGFLTLLGVTPVLGRMFHADDEGQPVVIVSDAFWRGKLASDPDVIGRSLVLGGRAHTIVGVLPPQFFFALNACDIWRPVPALRSETARAGYRVLVMARLERNGSAAAVAAAFDEVSRTSMPAARVVATNVATAIGGDARRTLGLLAGAAAVAVLMAFANFAGLLIVRSVDRRRELALRSALGAHRSEPARQLLFEALALVALGTLGGVLSASWMTPAASRLALEQFGALANREIAVSWRVIGVVGGAAFVCACICGLVAAMGASRWRVVDVLRRGATSSSHEHSLRRVFVASEVALAFVLLVSLALLGRTLISVLAINPGFDPRGLLTMQVSLPAATYASPERSVSFYSTLQRALVERLGARSVSIVDEIPLTGDRGRRVVSVDPADVGREAVVRTASPGYFDVMRVPVLAGRSFDAADVAGAETRVVVSRSLAQMLFGSEPPIGRRVRLGMGPNALTVEIVGVVGDVTHRALDEPSLPTVYLSALQEPSRGSILVVRSTRSDADVIAIVREAVARLDASLPVYRIRTMQEVVAVSPGVPARRLLTAAFTAFAVLGVVLSAIGLFGVVAHDVARRRAELAIRTALGADPLRLLRATMGQGVLMMGYGFAAGGVLSIWAVRALGGVIVTLGQPDALNITAAAGILIATGLGAVLPAALRAAYTDPLIALRSE